jgi:hypothetical protein
MKQTAVQWFANKMMTEYHSKKEWDDIFEQAKEMEKQQIIDAVCQHDIRNHFIISSNGILNSIKQAKEYFNKTFKSK